MQSFYLFSGQTFVHDGHEQLMTLLYTLKQNWPGGVIGALISVAIALALHWTGLGDGAERLSYDLTSLQPAVHAPSDVIIVEMDELAHRALKQDYDKLWDRQLHAQLLRQLQRDEARLVVMDIFLGDAGTNGLSDGELALATAKNQKLAAAIRESSRLVLAMDWAPSLHPGIIGQSGVLPFSEFAEAASNRLGIAKADVDSDLTVRRLFTGTEQDPSLSWMAASLLRAPVTQHPERRVDERWLRYYGPTPAFRRVSYHMALEQPAGFFRNKIVFIGGRPRTLLMAQQSDVFRTPYLRWRSEFTPGVEIIATSTMNLLRGDWLIRMSAGAELGIFLISALLFGCGLVLLRPLLSAGMTVIAIFLVAACGLFLTHSRWFSWVGICAVQLPVALAWATLWNTRRLQQEKRALEESLDRFRAGKIPFAPEPKIADQAAAAAVPVGGSLAQTLISETKPGFPPPIPNHRLLRRIGEGAYGEVWLARDDLDLYHAVKVLYRERFKTAAPFEREFRGLQHFTPISRNHAGLVHILHVGRNDTDGYLFYIMELADCTSGNSVIDPNTYRAHSLAEDLKRYRGITPRECIALFLHLSAALDFLHQQHLIHRDIKPANIIFVRGLPKFADIGLVTTSFNPSENRSFVGTEMYLPPEGPGRPQADIYALGAVMYEALTGKPYGEAAAADDNTVGEARLGQNLRLKWIILRACEANPKRRYQSAAELHSDLLALGQDSGTPDSPAPA